uniref:PPIase cyclophilin-type domain-containing protein n=1 Tax=Arcella intermedia TaxID=1963864 RepID=A0A6B2L5H7_9EUKA
MTTGKVVLHTTVGPLDIELWSTQVPKACRNFIQLCLEGYYDGTIFHRIVKDYLVQGGDPTGSGTGGESIYGEPFKDEFHSRLRFSHRGIVSCASFGRDQNGSQFFITLGPAPELDKRNTIFGKVTGESLFNLLNMNSLEVDGNERPKKPPVIKRVEVLWNPFEDIVPREKPKSDEVTEKEKEQEQPRTLGTKNLSLLSFADEEEETEETFKPPKKVLAQEFKKPKKKMRSSLGEEEEEEETDISKREEIKKDKDKEDKDWEKPKEVETESQKLKKENESLIKELKSKKRKEREEDRKAAHEAKSVLLKDRQKYVKRKKFTQDEISNIFDSFVTKLHTQKENPESWVNHQLTFEADEKEQKHKTFDPNIDDGLEVLDSLKDPRPIPAEQHLNTHQRKLRATKNLEKW